MTYGAFLAKFFGGDFYFTLLIYALVLIFFFVIFKKYIYSIFDPFITGFVMPVVCSITIIIWLEINGYINNHTFGKLALYFAFFLFGFLKGEKVSLTTSSRIREESYNFFKLFYIVNFLFLLITFFLYWKAFGLNNWNDKIGSRAGNGFVIYLNNYFPIAMLILVNIKRIKYKKKNILDNFVYVVLLCLNILSGSKGALINFVCLYITVPLIIKYNYLNEKKDKSILSFKNLLIIIALASSVVMIIMLLYKAEGLSSMQLLTTIGLHFFEFGDIYYLTLPNDVYTELSFHSFPKFVFFSLIGPLYRLFPALVDRPIGFEIIDLLYHKTNSTTGPNARLFFMLLISGYKVLTYFIAMLIGYLFIKMRKGMFWGKSIFGIVFSCFLFLKGMVIFTDIGLFGISFFALIILLPFTYLITYFLICSTKYKL